MVVQEAIQLEMGWATVELVDIEGYPELSFELDVGFLGLSLSCLKKSSLNAVPVDVQGVNESFRACNCKPPERVEF